MTAQEIIMKDHFNEKARRLSAAQQAKNYGWGGITRVSKELGISDDTIRKGIKELSNPELLPQKERHPGGGRKKVEEIEEGLVEALEGLLDPKGDPMSPILWTSKSVKHLEKELHAQGYSAKHTTIGRILHEQGYSLRKNKKNIEEGTVHPDRDAQFWYIKEHTQQALMMDEPVLSIDCKKKEILGNFKQQGEEWSKEGKEVQVHDFANTRAIPYGIYDIAMNEGYVSVGIDHDTAAFAVASIRAWWDQIGSIVYAHATHIHITADGGGSNASRSHLFKYELQLLANEIGKTFCLYHFPPGTSKWNKIEHRLFSHISMNFRGRPLMDIETIVNCIAGTTTETGLRVQARFDEGEYPTKQKVETHVYEAIHITRHEFHGEWNYDISPQFS